MRLSGFASEIVEALSAFTEAIETGEVARMLEKPRPMTLQEYITNYECDGFVPGLVHECRDGGFRVFWEDEHCHAERVSPGLIVLKSMTDGRVIGVKIYPSGGPCDGK